MTETVLVVNDNEYQSQELVNTIQTRLGYKVIGASSHDDALSRLMPGSGLKPDLVLIDMSRPESEGLRIVQSIRMYKPQMPIIMLMPYGDDKIMGQAFSHGVSDILVKPFWLEQLRLALTNVVTIQRMGQYISYLERKHAGHILHSDIIGSSSAIRSAVSQVRQAAGESTPVWISGESGTGKELLASAIHGESKRVACPLVVVECSALASSSADAVLFGGKFPPGGSEHLRGKFQEAGEGTLVLKDVASLPVPVQQKLLQLMETGKLQQADGTQTAYTARLILTTNVINKPHLLALNSPLPDLREGCDTVIALPPLRERSGDIAELANHFMRVYAASENKKIRSLTPDALHHLEQSPWPGNIRELAHLVWRAVLLCGHESIEAGDLRLIQQLQPVHYENRKGSVTSQSNPLLLDVQGRMKDLESIEREVIQFALTYSGGCMTHAAKNLGIGRSTLYRRVNALKLDNYISRENQMTRPTIRMSSKELS
jgi:DNA-binding NtrC family response regulator